MDHLSFIFSLLLIVSVTTANFGSAIKANNPNGEEIEEVPKNKREIGALLADAGLNHFPEMVPNRQELEALLKRSHHNTEAKLHGPNDLEDQDGENPMPKIAPGIIIEGASLTLGLLQSILGIMGDVSRKCAIGVDNESGFDWEQGSTYFYSGTADENLPFSLPSGYAALYGPRKSSGPTATGAVGVLAYYISSIDKTISVMFSVPFDYNFYENWWNVKLYPGNERANSDQYADLYYDANPFQANGWHQRSLGSGLKFRGSMSSSGTATLEIHVLKE